MTPSFPFPRIQLLSFSFIVFSSPSLSFLSCWGHLSHHCIQVAMHWLVFYGPPDSSLLPTYSLLHTNTWGVVLKYTSGLATCPFGFPRGRTQDKETRAGTWSGRQKTGIWKMRQRREGRPDRGHYQISCCWRQLELKLPRKFWKPVYSTYLRVISLEGLGNWGI